MKLTYDQRVLIDALTKGRAATQKSAPDAGWLDCDAESYRTACSLKRRDLIEIHPDRNHLGDYKARLKESAQPE